MLLWFTAQQYPKVAKFRWYTESQRESQQNIIYRTTFLTWYKCAIYKTSKLKAGLSNSSRPGPNVWHGVNLRATSDPQTSSTFWIWSCASSTRLCSMEPQSNCACSTAPEQHTASLELRGSQQLLSTPGHELEQAAHASRRAIRHTT